MARYCTALDVKMWVSTTIDPELLEELIDQVSGEIDKRVGAQSESDSVITKLCALIVAYGIKLQYPQSETLGATRKIDMGRTLELWDKEIQRLYKLYKTPIIKTSEYASIDEDSRFPG